MKYRFVNQENSSLENPGKIDGVPVDRWLFRTFGPPVRNDKQHVEMRISDNGVEFRRRGLIVVASPSGITHVPGEYVVMVPMLFNRELGEGERVAAAAQRIIKDGVCLFAPDGGGIQPALNYLKPVAKQTVPKTRRRWVETT